VMKPDLSDDRELAPGLGGFHEAPAWSPREDWIVFSLTANQLGGDSNLFLVRPDGSGLHQLTAFPENEDEPFFSADGRRVFFMRSPAWGDDPFSVVWWQSIWSVAVDGSDLQEHSFGDAFANLFEGAASPLGDRLAFSGGGITVAALDGTSVERVSSDLFARAPAWSPDGRTLTYWAHGDGATTTLWRVPADSSTGKAIALRHGAQSFTYGPDWISDDPRATAAGRVPDRLAPEVTLARMVGREGRVRPRFGAGTGPNAPRKLRVKDPDELAFVTLDRTGVRRVSVAVRRRGREARVRNTSRYVLRSKKDWARLKDELRRGRYELTFKTADVAGNSTRQPTLTLRVAR